MIDTDSDGRETRGTLGARMEICRGAGLPGGQFKLPNTIPGVTCQVCALDFVDDGTGIVPKHSGSDGPG